MRIIGVLIVGAIFFGAMFTLLDTAVTALQHGLSASLPGHAAAATLTIARGGSGSGSGHGSGHHVHHKATSIV